MFAHAGTSRRLVEREGFTLVEMVVVCAIIGMIVAIAAPQLMPALIFSRLDGAARHLAGYGSAAISYATLTRQDITIKFDLGKGEYESYRVTRTDSSDSSLFKDDKQNTSSKQDSASKKNEGNEDILELMSRNDGKLSEEQLQTCADVMRERFANHIKSQMIARARKIKKEDGILKDIGPLFEKPFKLDEEAEEEPLNDPLLEKTVLPEGIVIESIQIGSGEEQSSGNVDIELTSMGLTERVTFCLKNEDDDYMTVRWDPVTASVSVKRGMPGETDETDTTSDKGTAPNGAPTQAQ